MKFIPNMADTRLFDGFQEELRGQVFTVQLPNGNTATFDITEFTKFQGKNLAQLDSVVGKEVFDRVVAEGGFIPRDPEAYDYYKSETHIAVVYFIKDGYLFVFTFGEKQPSRWILILEGLWEMNE